jgi:GrpB-like predicted nucleotidyltransferase (UPF0157 family)
MIVEKYENLPVVLYDYDPDVTHVAEELKKIVVDKISFSQVEHIGSTSIPNCFGKGIVDLMIIYPKGRLDEVKCGLRELGFQAQTTSDPFPEDRPMRVGAVTYNQKSIRVHAHVLAEDSSEILTYRRFRNLLRDNSTVLDEYVALKKQIISSGITDSVRYSELKSSFFTRFATLE